MDNTTPTQVPTTPPLAPPVAAPVTQPAPPPPPAEEHAKGMFPWKTLLLILVLVGVTGGLLYVALAPKLKLQQVSMEPTPTVSPAHTTMSLSQNAATASGTTSLSVTIDTDVHKVTGVQFEIAYDPTVVTNVVVSSGDFLPQPTVLLNTVDTKNGRISYAAALSPTAQPVTGKGIVATISYTLAQATLTSKETTFKFLPKTKATQDDVLDSVLKTTTDLTVTLPGVDTLPNTSAH